MRPSLTIAPLGEAVQFPEQRTMKQTDAWLAGIEAMIRCPPLERPQVMLQLKKRAKSCNDFDILANSRNPADIHFQFWGKDHCGSASFSRQELRCVSDDTRAGTSQAIGMFMLQSSSCVLATLLKKA